MRPLTSLRFLAAALIVAYHASGQGLLPGGWMSRCVPEQAVSLFFVLSGFVLAHTYGGDLRGLSPAAFLSQRLAGVWPLHLTVLGAVLLFMPVQFAGGSPLATALLLHAWVPDQSVFFPGLDAPSWSPSAELAFYAAFPWLTPHVRRFPGRCLAIAGVGALALVAAVHLSGVSDLWALHVLPAARVPEFILGMAAAECLARLRRVQAHRAAWTAAEVGAVLVLIGSSLACAAVSPWASEHMGAAAAQYLRSAGSAPAAAALILVLAVGRGSVSRVLSARPLVFLGEASFALYLVHWPALSIEWAGGGCGYLAAVATLAVLGHPAVERPAHAMARRGLACIGRVRPAAVPA